VSIAGVFGTSAKANMVSQVLSTGLARGNLSAAITQYGAQLTLEDKNVLLSLTPGELSALQSVNAKLAPLGISALY
jgi:hypothetical protein